MTPTTHMQEFNQRLLGMFERKAEEFSRFAEEQPTRTAAVASQIADMYRELAESMRR